MFVDASALTAVLTLEEESLALLERLQATPVRLTSPLAVWETTVAVARVLDLLINEAATAVENYLELAEIAVAPLAPGTAKIALDAFARYGKGHHPARLNFGDCFAYACARHLGQPLLFKGEDFAQTDIEVA